MYLSSAECYLIDKLNCGTADLCMLDELYSTLGEACVDTQELVQSCSNLNELLSELYYSVTSSIADDIRDVAEQKETLHLIIGDENIDLEITDEIAEELEKYADNLDDNNSPYANCLDTHFQNELDQTVDWDTGVRGNVEYLLQYLIKNEEIDIQIPCTEE